MERKNWIWFAVTLAAVAAFAVCIVMLRSGSRHVAPTLNAPPPLQTDERVQTPAPEPPQSEPEAEPQPAAPGVLDMAALRERCRAVLTLAAQNEALGDYPVEAAEIVDGGAGAAFARTFRRPPAAVNGEPRSHYRSDAAGAYQLSDAYAPELRLCGDGVADTQRRTVETFTGDAVPAFVIACGDSCLRVEGDAFTASGPRMATRWVREPDTGFWYTVSAGRRRYLNSGGLDETGRTRWTLDDGVLRGEDADGSFALCCRDGSWMLTAEGAVYLTDREDRCLNMNETGVLPDTGRGTLWLYDRDDTGPGGYLYTYQNGRRYTLSLQAGQLVLSDDPYADYWLYQNDALFLTKDGQTWYLSCRGGAWRAEPTTAWRISAGEHYLSADSDGVTDETRADSATLWRIEDAGEGVVISTGGTEPRYLGFEEHSLLLLPDRRTLWQRGEDSLRSGDGGVCYDLRWSLGAGDPLRFEQAALPAPTVRMREAEAASAVELLPAEDLQLTERGETAELPSGPLCCAPLCCAEDLTAAADNPGYLCPGAQPMRLLPMEQAAFAQGLADGEVQALTCSASDGTLRPARADEGEFGPNCRRFLESVADRGLWGLRLAGTPDAEVPAVLPLARFGGENLRDCELARGCIDLRLAQGGTLSVFAAGGAAGIFDLYSVERDPESGRISALRKISRIFRGQDRFVYDYAEGGLPVREDAVLAFDTAWLRDAARQDTLYYFDIPLNAGEFALAAASETEESGTLLYLAVSEQALAAAPAPEGAMVWDVLSDRSLLTFLRDGANAAALGALLRADAAPLIDRVGSIADDTLREQAAELLEALSDAPDAPDWSALPDAAFVRWLCEPDNARQIQTQLEEDRDLLDARIASLVSHADYFLARSRLNALIQPE